MTAPSLTPEQMAMLRELASALDDLEEEWAPSEVLRGDPAMLMPQLEALGLVYSVYDDFGWLGNFWCLTEAGKAALAGGGGE